MLEGAEQIDEILNRDYSVALENVIEGSAASAATATLLKDLDLYKWAQQNTVLKGGAQRLWNKLQNPLPGAIETRLPELAQKMPAGLRGHLAELRPLEDDALWIFSNLPPLKDAWPMGMLFPTWPIVNRINNHAAFVEFFHIYRGYIAPWTHLLSPALTLVGPYYYIRRTMKWNLPFATYAQFIKKGLTQYLKPQPGIGPAAAAYKYLFLAMYIGVFLYSIAQSVEVARMLRDVRAKLLAKRRAIEKFIEVGRTLGVELRLPAGLAGLHKLWTHQRTRAQYRRVLRAVYAADVTETVRQLLAPGGGYVCAVGAMGAEGAVTRIWGQGHALLDNQQVRNPVCLRDNLIVTGPNAAGKTTYIKAIAANYILAQTLGICCAQRAVIKPVGIIGSFIRVSDQIGQASLFEAEVERCRSLYKIAAEASASGTGGVFFIDEPMHSTPPIEGAAMATAFVQALGALPGIRVIVTTHYHTMTRILGRAGAGFANVSMDALSNGDATERFTFPYKLRAGPSYQCIAIELLKEHDLPDEVVESAIKIKKELYAREIV